MKIKSTYFNKQFDLAKSQLVGQGNFAQVYKIYDSQLKQFLAIRKVLKNQAQIQDLDKEKQINQELMKVQNQNILKIYDIIDGKQYIWYITQYCEGGSLWDALNQVKDNKMNDKYAMECILQISKGVQQLHNHRITHRDLKPQNILLKNKFVFGKQLPVLKLADFGLSTKKIIMQTIAGTKQYIAPQQAKFQNYTNAVDVWSLGIICDQILHGTPYYSGQNNKEVFNKILKMPYKVRDESIRESIKQLLQSLLKKKPYQRPIIAVIRKSIQRILEQIYAENPKKQKNSQIQNNYLSSGMKKQKHDKTVQVGIPKKNQKQEKIQTKYHRNDKFIDSLRVPFKKQDISSKSNQKSNYRQKSEEGLLNLKSSQQVNIHKLRRLDSDQQNVFSSATNSINKKNIIQGKARQIKKQDRFGTNKNQNSQSATSFHNEDKLKYSRQRLYLQRKNGQKQSKNNRFRQNMKDRSKLQINTDIDDLKTSQMEKTPNKNRIVSKDQQISNSSNSNKKPNLEQFDDLSDKGIQLNTHDLHTQNSNLKYSKPSQNKQLKEKQKALGKSRDFIYSLQNSTNLKDSNLHQSKEQNKQKNKLQQKNKHQKNQQSQKSQTHENYLQNNSGHQRRKGSNLHTENQSKLQQNNSLMSSNKKSIHSHSNTNTNTNPDSQKIFIHKIEKKKTYVSQSGGLKKEDDKFDIVDLATYTQKVFKAKRDLQKSELKVSGQKTFIPNSNLTAIQVNNLISPDQSFTQFKKKMSFLNYFNTQPQYQIKLYKANQQIERQKQKAIIQMRLYKQKIKQSFLNQMDAFIDIYVEKVIK